MADIVTLQSKTADFSSAVSGFRGVTLKSLWDSEADATKFYGTDGNYISSDNTDSTVLDGDIGSPTLAISDTTGILVGMFCYVDSPALNAPAYYEITGVTTDTLITIEPDSLDGVIGGISADENVSYYIGGVSDAFTTTAKLQGSFNFIGPACAATFGNAVNNLDILCHASTAAVLTAKVNIDAISGSTTTHVRVTATDASFVNTGTDMLEINTVTASLVSLFDFNVSGNSIYITFANFDFNANNGVGASDTAHTINESDTGGASDNIRFINCKFRDAASHGVWQQSDIWTLDGCSLTGNGGDGLQNNNDGTENSIVNCLVDGNIGNGLSVGQGNATIVGCTITNNAIGIVYTNNGGDRSTVSNNTIEGNSSDGIRYLNGTVQNNCVNNSISNNGGYGINFNGLTAGTFGVFAFNHSYNNVSGHSNLTSTDAEFQTLMDGHNITDSTASQWESETPTDSDFMQPKSTSPLLGKGAGQFIGTGQDGYDIGAKCAIAGGGAGGGGVMPMTGLIA
jgi:hypothetical protein